MKGRNDEAFPDLSPMKYLLRRGRNDEKAKEKYYFGKMELYYPMRTFECIFIFLIFQEKFAKTTSDDN